MSNFFLAKFATVSASEAFKPNKNLDYPVIGEIIAGIARGSIMDGTMFKRDNLKEGQIYLCENFIDAEYPDNVRTRVISEINGYKEIAEARKDLGTGKLIRPNADSTEGTPTVAVTADETLVSEEADNQVV